MEYSMVVDLKEQNKLDKQQVIYFYNVFEHFLNSIDKTDDYESSSSFEVRLKNQELEAKFQSINDFNNEILSSSEIEFLQSHFMRYKHNEKYVISLFYNSYNFLVSVTGTNKLWVDETSLGIKKALSTNYIIKVSENNDFSRRKKEIFKEPMFIVAVLTLIITTVGVFFSITSK